MIDKTGENNSINLQRLLFRRQFLLGPKPFTPTQYWSCVQLQNGFHLSVHDDLPFISETRNGVSVTLLGIAIDPLNPHLTESDILQLLITKASSITTFIDETTPLAGRWVIILQNSSDTYIFTDPCGFRQVFYYVDGQQFLCGSQPEIIKKNQQLSLATDEDLINFIMKPEFSRSESAWVGDKTIYEKCMHLMPNHYLDVANCEQIRFYPSRNPISIKNMTEVVDLSASILQGIMKAITKRYNVCLALTAGFDSRVLLAASRNVCEHIEYYIYRTGICSESNPDVWVPKRLAKKLNIHFVVKDPAEELPGWFISILSQNVTGARVRPKTHHIFHKLVSGERRININGNAGEICRNYFDKYCKIDPKAIYSTSLSQILGFQNLPFLEQELNVWQKSLHYGLTDGLNILDMLYWEQRLGNWGAQYPAEQDIAVEEISPFNCRLLIETLSAVPRHLRAAPDYQLFREIIRCLWPDALSFPINPTQKGDVIGFLWSKVEPHIPISTIPLLKKILK